MNDEKIRNIEFVSHEQEKDEVSSFSFRDLIDGSILTRKIVVKQLPFILFLTFLALLYIGNRYHTERLFRQVSSLKTEVENLRAEQITSTARLMNMSRPSAVAKMVEEKNLEIRELTEPPKVLVRKKNSK